MIPALEFFNTVQLKYLLPLLKEHRRFFESGGLNLKELPSDESEAADALHEVLTKAPDKVPSQLLYALFQAERAATEVIADKLRDHPELKIPKGDLTPGDIALFVRKRRADLLQEALDSVEPDVKKFVEFVAEAKPLTLRKARAAAKKLKKRLGPFFRNRGRSAACYVHVHQDDDELVFLIVHGKLFRALGTIDGETLERSRAVFRPQKHDLVIYSPDKGLLKVHATHKKEQREYRLAFGALLFDDEDHFQEGERYTLKPLRTLKELPATEGIESATVTELWIRKSKETVIKAHSNDVLSTIRSGSVKLEDGDELIRAHLRIRYASGGHARRVVIRPPNLAEYDREEHVEETENFLRETGLELDLEEPSG